MDFCSGEHRRIWNQNNYCGHGRPIEACTVEGCGAHALYEKVKLWELYT
jgi:hypothetical protein